ncbi:short-chain dehydrogenase [Halobacillus litoralis]|uniref:short-chain dehydrogenase n=1 Tax=Halobacillus litoralis TaxID=45668 RepID=UPI00248FF126|nr:short-chain dehydrogenase [Halobacillus litoralis]
MKHALIIGGTGMLSQFTRRMAVAGDHVSVVARNSEKMERLEAGLANADMLTKLYVNYDNSEGLREKIRTTVKHNGPIDIVIAWIHTSAPEALQIVIDEVAKPENSVRIFQVLGSRGTPESQRRSLNLPQQIQYRSVILGSVENEDGFRWLTHEEISEGVWDAVTNDYIASVIGKQ